MRHFYSLFIIHLILLCACTDVKQHTSENKPFALTDSAKVQVFYQQFQTDSAWVYNEQYLEKTTHNQAKLRIPALVLKIRLARLLGKKEIIPAITDSVKQQLSLLPDSIPDLYALYWNEKGENFIGTNYDSALYFAQKAQPFIEKIKEKKEDYFIRNERIVERVYLSQNELSKAFSSLKKIQTACESSTFNNPYLSYLCYSDWGYAHYYNQNKYEAQQSYAKAYQIISTQFPHQRQRIADLGLFLGELYGRVGKYEQALQLLRSTSEQYQQLNNAEKTSACYHKIGLILYEQGESDLAIEYFQKALHLVSGATKPYILNDIGLAYKDKKDYALATHYVKQTLPIYKEQQAIVDEATAYLNLATFQYLAGKYDSALYYFQKFPQIDTNNDGKWLTFQQLYMWGNTLCKLNRLAESEQKLQNALALANELNENKSWQKAEIYMGLADVYKAKKEIPAALAASQKAICSLLYQYSDSNFRENPPLKAIVFPKYLLTAMSQKADLLKNLYQSEKKTEDLALCLATQELAQNLIDSIRLDFQGNSSKLSLMGELFPLYESSIQTALQLYKITQDKQYIEKAFLYTERNKATILYESLQSKKATQIAGVPDSLLRKVNDLQTEIGYLEHELYAFEGENRDSIQDIVLGMREKFQKVSKQLERDFPDYYKTRYTIELPKIADFRKQLAQNEQGLVEFFVGDSTTYIFYLDDKNIDVNAFQMTESFVQQIQDLRKQLSQRTFIDKPEEAYKTFTETAYNLYQTLIQPIDKQLTKEKLLIIPDGLLGYIPFEILLAQPGNTSKINYIDLPYLLRKFEISYAYSGTIWLNPLPSTHAASRSCIAFAPVFSGENKVFTPTRDSKRQELATLENTRSEVAEVGKQTHGDVFTDNKATESLFKQEAAHYQIIHLATHALINDENPLDLKLAFAEEKGENDGFLYVYELFGMRLNADMAVLSACNTGNGKLQRGEGVMSLARGFAQAGVPAIVMSLWTAQDQSTAQIMANFYQCLSSGETKDCALRKAKLSYLDNSSKIASHPYFWAAFVLMGDTSQMSFPTYKWYYVLAGLAILSIVGGIWWKRRKGKTT